MSTGVLRVLLHKATPVGSFALPLAKIRKVVWVLRVLLQELIAGPGGAEALTERCEVALQNLKPEAIRQTFMKPLAEPSIK